MKGCSTSCVIREMQLETAGRYHHTPIGMPQIQNAHSPQMQVGLWSHRDALSLLAGMQNVTFKDSLTVLDKTKHTIQSASCSPWYVPQWVENVSPHKNLHMHVYSSLIHNC